MGEEIDRQRDDAVCGKDVDDIHPAARALLQALVLPVTGLIAAGVLLVVGISLVFVALVLILALAAGAASVPLAVLAGRRRLGCARRRGREVLDAQATVRQIDAAENKEDGEPDASRR